MYKKERERETFTVSVKFAIGEDETGGFGCIARGFLFETVVKFQQLRQQGTPLQREREGGGGREGWWEVNFGVHVGL